MIAQLLRTSSTITAVSMILSMVALPAAPGRAAIGEINWTGTVLLPPNDAPAAGELIIRPPAGAQLPRVSVQLAGAELRMIRGSPSEVRVQLPAQVVSGPLVMTNIDTRQAGTLVPDYRVGGASAQMAVASGSTVSGATTGGGSGMHLQITIGGQDVPIGFGEDTWIANVGPFDVSAWLYCVEFDAALQAVPAGMGGAARPARFVVPVGKSTPVLFDGLRSNQRVDLRLHMFGRNASTGNVEPRFQYAIQQGRIVEVRLVGAAHVAGLPRYVELLVMPGIIVVESVTGGTSATVNVTGQGS